MLGEATRLLEGEYRAKGKEREFEVLGEFLAPREGSASFQDAAGRLGISAGAARVAAFRMRDRYRVLVRNAVRDTLSDAEATEDELIVLLDAVGGEAALR